MTHVIGIGTGRSGTTSLSRLLDGCEDVHVTHEDMPCLAWHKSGRYVERALRYWDAIEEPRGATHIGDVAAWHLNYVEDYMRTLGDVRVIAMYRAEDAVVESWLEVLGWKEFLLSDGTQGQRMWPTFECDPETAVRRYWRMYQHRVDRLIDQYPERVNRADVGDLNTQTGQSRIMSAAHIPFDQRRFLDRPKRNQASGQSDIERKISHRIHQAQQL